MKEASGLISRVKHKFSEYKHSARNAAAMTLLLATIALSACDSSPTHFNPSVLPDIPPIAATTLTQLRYAEPVLRPSTAPLPSNIWKPSKLPLVGDKVDLAEVQSLAFSRSLWERCATKVSGTPLQTWNSWVAGPKGNYMGRTIYSDGKNPSIIQIVSNKLLSEQYPLTVTLEQKLAVLNMSYTEYLQRIRAAVLNHEVRHLCEGRFKNAIPIKLFDAIGILDTSQIKSDTVIINGAVISADGKTEENIEELYANAGLIDITLDPSVQVLGWQDPNVNQFKPELEALMWLDFNNGLLNSIDAAHAKGDLGKMKSDIRAAAFKLMRGAMLNDVSQDRTTIDANAGKFADQFSNAFFKSLMYPDHSVKFGKVLQDLGMDFGKP